MEVPFFSENNLIVRLSKMAFRTLEGMQVLKKWHRRRLEDWGDDVRWNLEDDPPLVLHPKVEAPPKHEKEGMSCAYFQIRIVRRQLAKFV